MTQLQPLLSQSLPCLDIKQCGHISIWVAQCLGEFVLTKECQSTGQRHSSISMKSWRANRTPRMKHFQTFTPVWRMWPPSGSSCVVETLLILWRWMQQQSLIICCPYYWYWVHSWVMYAPKTCTFMMPLSVVYICVIYTCNCLMCHLVLMYVYICVERENGWLRPTAWQWYTKARCHRHHSAGPSLRYIPRRAVLYCPGNDERKLRKLASLDVDCAVLDCEDGVALSKKVHKHPDACVWMKCGYVWKGQQGAHRHTHSCVILNDSNSISLLQTGARS